MITVSSHIPSTQDDEVLLKLLALNDFKLIIGVNDYPCLSINDQQRSWKHRNSAVFSTSLEQAFYFTRKCYPKVSGHRYSKFKMSWVLVGTRHKADYFSQLAA